jgi:hypothetical protein
MRKGRQTASHGKPSRLSRASLKMAVNRLLLSYHADGYTFSMPAKTGQFPSMARTPSAVFGRSMKDGSVVLPSSIAAGSGVTHGKSADMSVADAQG